MRLLKSPSVSSGLRLVLTVSLIVCAAAMLAACGPSIAIDGCKIFGPIRGSKLDTAETRLQVDEHNAKGVGACGWSRMA